MALKIISADERLAQNSGIKGVILGPSGVGKTTLARTVDNALFIDLEAGMLALEGYKIDSIPMRDWVSARNFACWVGGPNPAMRPEQNYSQAHFDTVRNDYGDPAEMLSKYGTLFFDSITVASRLCFNYCKGQPEAFSEKTGKPDNRGAYGLLGQEMVGWLTQLQHIHGKNVWLVGILNKGQDDYGRTVYEPQIEGGSTKLALPGIVDQVVSMVELKTEDGTPYRAFVCQTLNEWGFPAKDRSGRLDVIEEPHLGKLMAKIKSGARKTEIKTEMPSAA